MMMTADTARAVLAWAGVGPEPGGGWPDFFTLRAGTVERLLEDADARRYRKPKAANGSRGRYWYGYLVRRAGRSQEGPR